MAIWVLYIGGGLVLVTPGMLDPMAPINGLSLVGLALIGFAWYLTVRNG
jgi:hypothetical protein